MPGSGRQRTSTGVNALTQQARRKGAANKIWFAENLIKIVDARSQLIPLHLRFGQRQAREARQVQIDAGLPVRQYVLKSRQIGLSTDALADTFTDVYCLDNRKGVIIAHDKPRANEHLAKCHDFNRHMPPALQLRLAKSSTSHMQYADTGSGLTVLTAANFESQRGGTLQNAVATEFCFYPQPLQLLAGLNIVVHDIPGTQVIIETTARGSGSEAHQFWQACMEGETGYEPLFLRWQDDPLERDLKKRTDLEWRALLETIFFEYPGLKDRSIEYNFTREQLSWYYDKLKRVCNGDELLCQQEYPCSAEEAWLSSGTPIFPIDLLGKYRAKANEQSGQTYDLKHLGQYTLIRSLDKLAKVEINKEREDYFEIWQPPIAKRQYLIGADGAAGYMDGDYSSAFVVDLKTLDMVAEFHGRVEPGDFAKILASMGYIYNQAIIAPEIEGVGWAVITQLREFYWNLYRWRVVDGYTLKPTNRIGWSTNSVSRTVMITNAKKLFMERARDVDSMHQFIRSRPLLDELFTFCVSDMNGKPEALSGHHDDRVMAWAIALTCAMQETYGIVVDERSDIPTELIARPMEGAKVYRGPSMESMADDIFDETLDRERDEWIAR